MDENEYNELFGLTPEDPGAGETVEPDTGGEQDDVEKTPPDGGQDGQGAGESAKPEIPAESGEASGEAGRPGVRPVQSTASERDGTASERAGKRGGPYVEEGKPPDSGSRDDDVIRGLNITDPYTHKPITTREEYDAYRERAYKERRQLIQDRTGMSDAELDEFIAAIPEVRKARADGAQARAFIRRERERQARERVDAEVKKIAAMDPEIRSIADLTESENYDQLLGLVKRGYDLADAYKLANFDKLRQRAQDASRQAAHNSRSGREGMQKTRQSGQGGDSVPVPADVKELYRSLNPGASDEEIRKYYNSYLRSARK